MAKIFVTSWFQLKVLPSSSVEEGQGHEASGRSQEASGRSQEVSGRSQTTLRYGCLLELSFPQHGVSSRGVAVLEETFSLSGTPGTHLVHTWYTHGTNLVHIVDTWYT